VRWEVTMSKQTALQWFVDKLPHSIETQFSKQIQQAMQMEREQIEEAFNVYGTYAEAEEYFNEIYGGNKLVYNQHYNGILNNAKTVLNITHYKKMDIPLLKKKLLNKHLKWNVSRSRGLMVMD